MLTSQWRHKAEEQSHNSVTKQQGLLRISLPPSAVSSSITSLRNSWAILFSLSLTAWQVYTQEKTSKQWMTMLQEMVFQTYFLTFLADKPEISQLAQHRLGQVLKTLNGEQQVSMLQFFSHNGLPATFIGDALRGSTGLAGADLQQIELPQIQLAQAKVKPISARRHCIVSTSLVPICPKRAS